MSEVSLYVKGVAPGFRVTRYANFEALARQVCRRENGNRSYSHNFGAPPRQVKNGEGGNSMVVVVEGAAFVEISMEEFPMELLGDFFQKLAPS